MRSLYKGDISLLVSVPDVCHVIEETQSTLFDGDHLEEAILLFFHFIVAVVYELGSDETLQHFYDWGLDDDGTIIIYCCYLWELFIQCYYSTDMVVFAIRGVPIIWIQEAFRKLNFIVAGRTFTPCCFALGAELKNAVINQVKCNGFVLFDISHNSTYFLFRD